MRDFEYHRPGSLEEARERLRAANGGGKLMAGGQSLLPLMKLDLAEPSDVVSLSGLAELQGIRREGDGVSIGAGSTHTEVAESDLVRETLPGLAEMAERIGDPQVRNRGTLGGSVAHADPAADYPAALVALEATVITDRRRIPAAEFFLGMWATALEDDEIITAVHFPVPDCAAYAKFPNPASLFALAGVMVARTGGEARVAVTGAGPGVFRVEEMERRLAEDFRPEAIEDVEIDATDLLDDGDASAEYRAHLVGVMARRAVAECA
ncbi:MAG: xanthine dehydrogenase family protein subunit M [Gemmatimonadota bacterium]|jgi:carbon-monoxide dehydrogenase medium subunit